MSEEFRKVENSEEFTIWSDGTVVIQLSRNSWDRWPVLKALADKFFAVVKESDVKDSTGGKE